jgi:hypothetical protein
MKLQELAASPTKQAAKVFESYFGGRIKLDHLGRRQTRNLLNRVRGLVQEHRRTSEFHKSEKNPTYLKLLMLEQVLAKKMYEDVATAAMTQPGAVPPTGTVSTQTGAQAAALASTQLAQKKKQIQDQLTALKQQKVEIDKKIADAQQALNNPAAMAAPAMENRRHNRLYRRLHESEIQQAQVVLAAQDMVDRVQKMLEDVTSMQFKDLPALVDQVKNEVGIQQSAQFNTDATTALSGLVQNLQASKTQLEQALGVVTGQEVSPPGMNALGGKQPPAPAGAPELGADTNMNNDDDLEADLDLDSNMRTPPAALGRGRR